MIRHILSWSCFSVILWADVAIRETLKKILRFSGRDCSSGRNEILSIFKKKTNKHDILRERHLVF